MRYPPQVGEELTLLYPDQREEERLENCSCLSCSRLTDKVRRIMKLLLLTVKMDKFVVYCLFIIIGEVLVQYKLGIKGKCITSQECGVAT